MSFTAQLRRVRNVLEASKQSARAAWLRHSHARPRGAAGPATLIMTRQAPADRRSWIPAPDSQLVRRSYPATDGAARRVSLNRTRVRSYGGANAVLWPELETLVGVGRVRRCGAYRIRRIGNPGRVLDADRAAALHHMCARASSLSFGVDHSKYWASRPEYFNENSEWWVVECEGDLAGWHAIAVWRGDCGTVLYHDMLVLLPAHRRTGLGALLVHEAWLRVAARTRSLPIGACRTQNPMVLRLFDRFMTRAYPRPDGCGEGPVHERAMAAARLVAEKKHASTVPACGTFVARGVFPCSLYERPPACGDSLVNAFFAQLDVAAGDAVYVVGLMCPVGAFRALLRYGALHAALALKRRQHTGGNAR
jgi:GNAT superfamily N-acetyltransferase